MTAVSSACEQQHMGTCINVSKMNVCVLQCECDKRFYTMKVGRLEGLDSRGTRFVARTSDLLLSHAWSGVVRVCSDSSIGYSLVTSCLILQEVLQWWEAVHLWVLQQRCTEAGLHDLAAKQATSLLRYITLIPADKAFYEAGRLYRQAFIP